MRPKTTVFMALLLPICACSWGSPAQVSLHEAALTGDLEAVQQHIASGSNLDEKDPWGSTPLIVAATFGNDDVAKALIEAGADLAIANSDGSTPLHVAAFLCRTEIVSSLLRHGADQNLRNRFGHTPLDTVLAPFDDVRPIYDSLGRSLAPLGLQLDLRRLEKTRPKIAAMLHDES